MINDLKSTKNWTLDQKIEFAKYKLQGATAGPCN